jgi:hypothetical protein
LPTDPRPEQPQEREQTFGRALGAFSWKLAVGTLLAGLAVFLVVKWRGGLDLPATQAHPERLAPAPAPGQATAAADPAHPGEGPHGLGPATGLARDIEARHARGELSDAQKRFEPCPGGDLRRTAWIDREQRVVKLVRERADGVRIDAWFDEEGRLAEALVQGQAGGRPWARRITVGQGRHETVEEVPGSAVPEAPPPAPDREDPTAAFFGGPGCAR